MRKDSRAEAPPFLIPYPLLAMAVALCMAIAVVIAATLVQPGVLVREHGVLETWSLLGWVLSVGMAGWTARIAAKQGADGLLAPAAEDIAGWARQTSATGWVEAYMFSLGPAIAGGASNIQLNIIGERGYGLPRDPRPAQGSDGS